MFRIEVNGRVEFQDFSLRYFQKALTQELIANRGNNRVIAFQYRDGKWHELNTRDILHTKAEF